MINITSINDLKEVIAQSGVKVIGVGGTPITRSEFASVIPDFELICSVDSKDEIAEVAKDMKITCFPVKNNSGRCAKKPSTIVSDARVQSYINNFKKIHKRVALIVFKPDALLLKIAQDNGWEIIGNTPDIISTYNSKQVFRDILKKTNIAQSATVTTLSDFYANTHAFFDRYGEVLVLQFAEKSGGGHGTFFCRQGDESSITQIQKRMSTWKEDLGDDPTVIIDAYFNGPVLSIAGCITKEAGIIVAQPQYQYIDIPEVVGKKDNATGVFCGHDWARSLPNEIAQVCCDMVQKIGLVLQKEGVRGFFGLDTIWDKDKNVIRPIEINVRLTGVFPAFMDVQIMHDEVPLGALHVLEFLNIPYTLDEQYKQSLLPRVGRKGAHMILFNTYGHDIVIQGSVKPGIYSYDFEYKRPGYRLAQLQANEVLLTDSVPQKGDIRKKNIKICKIASLESFTDDAGILTQKARTFIQKVYTAFNGR